jgi:serine/threonine protein kinase
MHPPRSAAVRVGRYELLRHLATGGMAELFLARAVGIADFEKLLVLKRILPQHAADALFIRMFLDEARLAATLHHSSIVQVFEVGRAEGTYFFTMEFVHGRDLRQVFQRSAGKVPLEHALGIVIEAAAGLHHAHEKRGSDGMPLGIVHRDVSPSNLLVGFDGAVKLGDFGIARATLAKQADAGTAAGKAPYMSPEQVLELPLDRRTDIFSLGVVLHELLTGKRLFRGNDAEVMERIAQEEIAPPSSLADVPHELDRVAARALARDRAARYATADELRADLEACARARGLYFSRAALSSWMADLFADEVEGWIEAQRTGLSLESYATSSIGRSMDAVLFEVEDEGPEAEAAPPAPRRSLRRALVAGGVALVLAATALVAIRLSTEEEPPAVPSPPAAAAPSVPVAPAQEEVAAESSPAADEAPPPRAAKRARKRRPPPRTSRPRRDPAEDGDARLEIFPRSSP